MMMFSTRQLSQVHKLDNVNITIHSSGQPLERVKSFKILGVHFNEHLGWKDHINIISKSCFATIRSLKLFKNSASWQIRKSLVESLVLSKMNYCNVLFCDATKTELNRLQKIQNAAAGFIFNQHAKIADCSL